jgi:ABC-type phosphate transport system substrate-binding protein
MLDILIQLKSSFSIGRPAAIGGFAMSIESSPAPIKAGLAGTLLATFAFLVPAGPSTGVADAAPSCAGASIAGLGTTLQKRAQQEAWAPAFASEVCNKGSFPTVTYNLIPSLTALDEWGADGEGGLNTSWQYLGTDLAPNGSEIEAISTAGGGAGVAVIPVAQTAIAIIANPPAGCAIEEITNKELAAVFDGTIDSWDQLATSFVEEGAAESACETPITRVVPNGGSGVALQFKNYLYQVHPEALFCTEGTEGKATWQELMPIGNRKTGAPNTTWPEACGEKALSGIVRPAGTATSEVVSKVNNTAGSFSYAPLPDAKYGEARTILGLQNNGTVKLANAAFANPLISSSANCFSMSYTVPAGAFGGIDVDWSAVFGAQPKIGGSHYPLCMLTYDVALHGYGAAGFESEGEPETVKDYLAEYVLASAGQVAANGNAYTRLPESATEAEDVRGAAEAAAAQIGY